MPYQFRRLPAEELRTLIANGRLRRDSYDFAWKSKPKIEGIDIVCVYFLEDIYGKQAYVILGTFGHRKLVSFQTTDMRDQARLVMYFPAEHTERLLVPNSEFRRYVTQRLRMVPEDLVPYIDDLVEFEGLQTVTP